ncbi:Midasin [Mizuhopecten yessoensis]|uniref:Midasin n=1 Tax=Mizuhopecten yessoensis TaxID=6573 RepID=A0A210PFL3_MIZYE|nr:Midasin [Mizuhopecten yessoensis]
MVTPPPSNTRPSTTVPRKLEFLSPSTEFEERHYLEKVPNSNVHDRKVYKEGRSFLNAVIRGGVQKYDVKGMRDRQVRDLMLFVKQMCPNLIFERTGTAKSIRKKISRHLMFLKTLRSDKLYSDPPVQRGREFLATELLEFEQVPVPREELQYNTEVSLFCDGHAVAIAAVISYPVVKNDMEEALKDKYVHLILRKTRRGSIVDPLPYNKDRRTWAQIKKGNTIIWPVDDICKVALYQENVLAEKTIRLQIQREIRRNSKAQGRGNQEANDEANRQGVNDDDDGMDIENHQDGGANQEADNGDMTNYPDDLVHLDVARGFGWMDEEENEDDGEARVFGRVEEEENGDDCEAREVGRVEEEEENGDDGEARDFGRVEEENGDDGEARDFGRVEEENGDDGEAMDFRCVEEENGDDGEAMDFGPVEKEENGDDGEIRDFGCVEDEEENGEDGEAMDFGCVEEAENEEDGEEEDSDDDNQNIVAAEDKGDHSSKQRLEIGKFVKVKFEVARGKRISIQHFSGMVMEKDPEILVKFLKDTTNSAIKVWPHIEDICIVEKEDLIMLEF